MLQRQFRCFAGQSGASYGSVRVLHEDAYFVGNVAGTVGGMVAAASIGNIAAGTSSLVACGSLAQKAAKLYTAIDTVAGIANATSNIAAGNASLGDALAFLPILTVGVQKLRGAPTNCFIAGTLVAVAGVVAGTSTADAGPSSASKRVRPPPPSPCRGQKGLGETWVRSGLEAVGPTSAPVGAWLA